jgi:integrase
MRGAPEPWFRKLKIENGGRWMATIGGKQYPLVDAENTSAGKKLAYQAFYALMATMAEPSESPDANVASVCDEFLTWAKDNCAPKTFEGHRFWIEQFVDACGKIKVRELKPIHVTRWVNSKSTWKSTSSKYNAFRNAKRAFSWAVQLGLLEKSPLAGMRIERPQPRNDFMEESVYQSLRRKAPWPLKTVLYALRQTGARPGEICQLKWKEVEQVRWVLSQHKTRRKTGRVREIYLSPNMQRLMRIMKSLRGGSEFVFLNCHGQPWNTDSIRQHIKRLATKLNLNTPAFAYQLRHTFATNAIRSGQNTVIVAAMLGHADTTMVSRVYAHVQGSPEVAAAFEAAARPYRPRPK